jgi:hypothetical protein
MGRYGPPRGGRIVDPRNLKTPVEITPRQQLAPYYGGPRGIADAILDAGLQAQRVSENLADFAPDSDLRHLFPEPDYSRLDQEVTVMPIRPDDPTFTGAAVSEKEFGMPVPIGEDPMQMMQAPDQLPALLMNKDPLQLGEDFLDPQGLGLMDDQGFKSLRRGETVEKPLTDFTLGFADNPTMERSQPLMDSDALGAAIAEAGLMGGSDSFGTGARIADLVRQSTSPVALDRSAAQIRRRTGGGESAMPYEQANRLINDAVQSAMQMARDNPLIEGGIQTGMIEPTTGLPVQDLIALGLLPEQYRRFMPTRMGEVIGLGGAMAGGMSQQGQSQGIDPRSTMGPLSGLMQ